MDMNIIVDMFLNQGIWAIMFVIFYADSTKKNAEREKQYRERETKYLDTISQCGIREHEYQKIIYEYNERIIPTLEEINKKL